MPQAKAISSIALSGALDLDRGIERDQRHAEVGRMRRDAGVAPPEHGMQAVFAMTRVAA